MVLERRTIGLNAVSVMAIPPLRSALAGASTAADLIIPTGGVIFGMAIVVVVAEAVVAFITMVVVVMATTISGVPMS